MRCHDNRFPGKEQFAEIFFAFFRESLVYGGQAFIEYQKIVIDLRKYTERQSRLLPCGKLLKWRKCQA